MIFAVKEWVLQLTGTAIIATAVMMVTPESRVKKAVSLACGCAMIIALLSIKINFDFESYSKKVAEYKLTMESYTGKIDELNKKLTRDIIEEESTAYILDKGKKLGIKQISASVNAKWDADASYWYLISAKIKTDANADQIKELSYYVEASLGIAKTEQVWSTYDED